MSDTRPAIDRCACDVALKSRLGHACNEEAFRHFVAMERKRSERSGRAFLLLLVRWRNAMARGSSMDTALAERLFACLWLCLRESDQVGWFREGRVAGALLADATTPELGPAVCEKVRRALQATLPPDVVGRLTVRAFRVAHHADGDSRGR